MRILALVLVASVGLVSCNNSNDKADVSGVDVGKVHIERFDTAFFHLDSNDIVNGLRRLDQEYPWFTPDFVGNILGAAEPLSDTSRLAFAATRQFLVTYLGVSDSLEQKYAVLDWLEKELRDGFRHVKYYFPQYKLPQKVVAFIGPFDGPGVAVTSFALAIGLQSYAGRNFPWYLTSKGQDLYPQYVSRRFEPEYITTNCMNAIAQDIVPDSSDNRPLIEQMIIKGRYFWLAGKLVPDVPDSIRTGYTKAQLDWCAGNEAAVWNYFLQATDLYTVDPDIIKNYIGEGPKTLGMPDAAPGNIGAWVGWQIVKKYVAGHKELSPEQVMTTPVRTIFEEAKYKPK
ncbi:MAG TPA: hypothetical protein VHE34_20240 [Puia sp.]|uniref:gliding motility lipoprotein GldB n=1 Tax=Puia sp. TaxID=2045100 RepID=UPI002B9F5C3A|nr:hypothetical protein [Puia sp.]HVU97570.1 hypothetical protein [Puia sp.]